MIGAVDMGADSWGDDDVPLDVDADAVDVDLSDLDATPRDAEWNAAIAAVRRRCEARYRGKIAELEAEIAKLRSPPPESPTVEPIESLLAREMNAAEFAEWSAAQRFPLRMWLEGATPTPPSPPPPRAPARPPAPTLPARFGDWGRSRT